MIDTCLLKAIRKFIVTVAAYPPVIIQLSRHCWNYVYFENHWLAKWKMRSMIPLRDATRMQTVFQRISMFSINENQTR
jgi:hypothetical protein